MINGIFSQSSYGNIHTLEKLPENFEISRPDGLFCYTMLFFKEPVMIWSEGKLIKTQSNALVFYYPYKKQYYKTISPVTHCWMHFDDSNGIVCEKCKFESSVIYYPKSADSLVRQFSKIQSEMLLRQDNYNISVDSLINLMLVNLSRSLNIGHLSNNIDSNIPKDYFNLRQNIMNNLGTKWNIPDLAKELGVSVPSFYMNYKKYFGLSPINELIHLRIEKAKYLIRATSQPILDIALQSGYTDIYHFSRQFKKYVGQSPTSFRKNSKSSNNP